VQNSGEHIALAEYLDSSLTASQLDDVPRESADAEALGRTMSPCAAVWSTITRNTWLCITCAVLWALIPNLVVAMLADGYLGRKVGLCFGTAFVYLVYLVAFVAPTGCCCFCFSSSANSGDCIYDLPFEAIRAPAAGGLAAAADHMRELALSAPALQLKVECWHTVSSRSGKHRRTKRVVTYRAEEDVAVVRWRDISVDPQAFADAVEEGGASLLGVSYVTAYEVSPAQQAELERCRARLHDAHQHRDKHCRAWFQYATAAHQPARIDNVVRRSSCRYQCSRLVVNYFWFYLSVWSTLYPLYITLWKVLQTPVDYRSVKYLHVIPPAPPSAEDA
jgi:hypothetical protein